MRSLTFLSAAAVLMEAEALSRMAGNDCGEIETDEK
jgi:hypothetical protein